MNDNGKDKRNGFITGIVHLILSIVAIVFSIFGKMSKIWGWIGVGWFVIAIMSLYRAQKGQPKNIDKRIKIGTIIGLVFVMILLLLVIMEIIDKLWLAVVIGLVAALAYSNYVMFNSKKTF